MSDETGQARLREKALGWLQADLTARSKLLDSENEPAQKQAMVQLLTRWKENPDLVGIRDESALMRYSEVEREKFRLLWAEVDRILSRAQVEPLPARSR